MRESFSSKALPSDSIAAGPRRANGRTPGRIDGCMCPQTCDTGVSLRDGNLAMTPAWSSRRRRLSTKHSRSSRENNSRNMQHRHFAFVSNPREIHEKTAQNSSFKNPCCYEKKKKTEGKKNCSSLHFTGSQLLSLTPSRRFQCQNVPFFLSYPYYPQTKSTLTPIARGGGKESEANNKN